LLTNSQETLLLLVCKPHFESPRTTLEMQEVDGFQEVSEEESPGLTDRLYSWDKQRSQGSSELLGKQPGPQSQRTMRLENEDFCWDTSAMQWGLCWTGGHDWGDFSIGMTSKVIR
jgi:hypothetical protein